MERGEAAPYLLSLPPFKANPVEATAAPSPISIISRNRLEMLCDGIFAIAMTILVLELKVPELVDRHSAAELAQSLERNRATFFSYLLSFLWLGIVWARHNEHFRHIETITKGVLALQLLQLATAAFFPFCAALVGRYPTNHLAMVIYFGCAVAYAWASQLGWLVAERAGALSPRLSDSARQQYGNRNLRRAILLTVFFGAVIAWAFAG